MFNKMMSVCLFDEDTPCIEQAESWKGFVLFSNTLLKKLFSPIIAKHVKVNINSFSFTLTIAIKVVASGYHYHLACKGT